MFNLFLKLLQVAVFCWRAAKIFSSVPGQAIGQAAGAGWAKKAGNGFGKRIWGAVLDWIGANIRV
jgi:hypothetical protein